jgi:hypothetical protein
MLEVGDGVFRATYEALADEIMGAPDCAAVVDEVERSAGKLAGRLLGELRAQGYYPAPAGVAA